MVIGRIVCRWLLRLFPAEFRQQFAEDIGEYLRLRNLEAEPLGPWSTASLWAHMAADLVVAAVKLRASAASTGRTALWLAATIGGLGMGVASVSLVLGAFELMIRTPLLALSKQGMDVGVAPRLSGLLAVIVALISCYAAMRPGPHKRRQSANRAD